MATRRAMRPRAALNDENASARVPGKAGLGGTVGLSKAPLAAKPQLTTKSTTASTLGVRKRAALGEVNSNANNPSTSQAAKDKPARAVSGAGARTRSSTSTTAPEPAEETEAAKPRLTRRTSGVNAASTSRSALPLATKTNIPRRTGATVAGKAPARKVKAEPVEPLEDEETVEEPAPKRLRTSVPQELVMPTLKPPKDEGWEDLDIGDEDDPMMVTTYVNEVYDYLKKLEVATQPDANYMDRQNELTWTMRRILIDWLVDVHSRFRLLPETIYLAAHIVDRFLSIRTVSLVKFQLVGVAALFIAAKYEEVVCPSVRNFLFMTDGGYEEDEILKAERYVLQMIGFDLSYPNPIHFLRRISKADGYDVQTRTIAKYFLEMSIIDHLFLPQLPSVTAAAATWLARKVLGRGDAWDPNLIHYSTYTEEELLPTAQLMLDYVVRNIRAKEPEAPQFHKKYSSKKFFKASLFVETWVDTEYKPAAGNTHMAIRLPEWKKYPTLSA